MSLFVLSFLFVSPDGAYPKYAALRHQRNLHFRFKRLTVPNSVHKIKRPSFEGLFSFPSVGASLTPPNSRRSRHRAERKKRSRIFLYFFVLGFTNRKKCGIIGLRHNYISNTGMCIFIFSVKAHAPISHTCVCEI